MSSPEHMPASGLQAGLQAEGELSADGIHVCRSDFAWLWVGSSLLLLIFIWEISYIPPFPSIPTQVLGVGSR